MRNGSYRVKPHGIQWGDAEIEFLFADPKAGRCLEIRTAKQRLQIRVTPGGKFRLGFARRPWNENSFRADHNAEAIEGGLRA